MPQDAEPATETKRAKKAIIRFPVRLVVVRVEPSTVPAD
jgi:hypothetical protein